MPRLRIRHYHGVECVFFPGEPPAALRSGAVIRCVEGGYYVTRAFLEHKQKEETRQKREALKVRRLVRGIRFGLGSGREGGGRGAAHTHHIKRWGTVPGTPPVRCPYCFDQKLYRRWLNLPFDEEHRRQRWNAETLMIEELLAKMSEKKRFDLYKKAGTFDQWRATVLQENAVQVKLLKEHLYRANVLFEAYERTITRWSYTEPSVLDILGVPYVYSRSLARLADVRPDVKLTVATQNGREWTSVTETAETHGTALPKENGSTPNSELKMTERHEERLPTDNRNK
jgi:hypothetical protein